MKGERYEGLIKRKRRAIRRRACSAFPSDGEEVAFSYT